MIYCRVSTKEQVDEGNSLVSQEKNCRDYAVKHGYEIVQLFIEQGESAKTANRTELRKLIDFCTSRKNNIQAVIAYKIDRISRNMDDYSQIRIMLKRCTVEIKSTSENFEDTPAGKFMENIIANVAQFDNDVRTERSIGGMRDAVREGRYVWMAPPGYINIKAGGKATITQSEQAPLIRKAFELVVNGYYSTEKIRQVINEDGLVTNRGKSITNSHFRKILRNPLYAGIIQKFGEVHTGLFTPIISEELFEQVQWLLDGKKKVCKHYLVENPDFPLRRFVQNEDGQKLTGAWSKGRRKKYPYYWFPIPKKPFRKEVMEQKFIAFLDSYRFSPSYYGEFRKWLYRNWIKKIENREKIALSFEQRIQELNERESILVKKNNDGVINDAVLKKQLDNIEEEIHALQQTKLQTKMYRLDEKDIFHRVKGFLLDPGIFWSQLSPEDKLKMQWFEFPEGIIFNGENFRTNKICRLFKPTDIFFSSNSYRAPSSFLTSNTTKTGNFEVDSENPCKSEALAEEIGQELIKLAQLLTENQ